jgi:hypothetical protein
VTINGWDGSHVHADKPLVSTRSHVIQGGMLLTRRILPVAGAALVTLAVFACSSSFGGSATSGVGACGLALFPQDFPSSCQTAMDQACCTQERACAANADCVHLVACVNACPAPRQDSCVNACAPADGGTPPGYTQLEAIASCSPTQAPTDSGTACAWPN